MNSVILIGRLTRDPEVRYTAGTQTAVCRFTLANDDGYGENKRTNFISCVVFGKQAENCEKYLAKGRLVCVQGRLQTGSYQNKDGATVYTTDVVANNVEFLGGGNSGGNRPQADSFAPQAAAQQPKESSFADDMPDPFQAIDDDVPF